MDELKNKENTVEENMPKIHFDPTDGKTVMEKNIPPLRYCIYPILPYGLYLLAGGAKVGKSWLAEQITACVASGTDFFDCPVEKSGVLYFALEDTERRLQSRFSNYDISLDDMANIQFLLKTENVDNGFVDYTIEYLSAHPEIKLVVVDTLQHIRGREYSKNVYEADVKFMEKLREITNACDVSVLLLHHTNKGSHDDIINAISGSEGLAAGSDGNWVLYKEKRTDTRAKITFSLRDGQSFENNLRFNGETCYWEKLDPTEERKDDKSILVETLPQLFSADRNHWEGTATDLLNELGNLNPAMRTITTGSLGKLLSTTESTLYHNYGIHIRRCTHNRHRWINMNYIEVK